MTTTTQPRVFPGMLCQGIEIFKSESGTKVISSGTVISFHDIPTPIYQTLKESMVHNKEAHAILKEWHPESELKQVEKFSECRFGGLDFTPDIIGNQLQEGEYHDCPFRGKCKGEGIVCKALKYKGNVLTAEDIELIRLLSTSDTNEVIAEKLNISLGQYHKIKKDLYARLGNIQTKQEATLIATELNLIKTTRTD
jgi:DNA-binding CsgD family transcriptional regulator